MATRGQRSVACMTSTFRIWSRRYSDSHLTIRKALLQETVTTTGRYTHHHLKIQNPPIS